MSNSVYGLERRAPSRRVSVGAPTRRVGARRSTAGFSLVEVMVAILILAIALAGLTHGITTALASNKEAELQTTAALLAQGKIEELRASGLLTDGEEEGDCGEALTLYRWRQTIVATDIAGLHEVTVVVENSRTGQAIYDLKTMLFEPPSDSPGSASSSRKKAKSKQRSEGD